MQEIKYSDTSVATIVNGCVGQSIFDGKLQPALQGSHKNVVH